MYVSRVFSDTGLFFLDSYKIIRQISFKLHFFQYRVAFDKTFNAVYLSFDLSQGHITFTIFISRTCLLLLFTKTIVIAAKNLKQDF